MGTCCSVTLNDIYELTNNKWDIENIQMKYYKTRFLIWNKKETLKSKCKIDIDFLLPHDMKGRQSKLFFKNQTPSLEKDFVDELFKPEQNSIVFVDKHKECSKDILPEEVNAISGLVWKRPSELFNGKKYFLYKDINVDDIKQGILGNCYFLSSISAIAEFKERIQKIIIQKEVTDNGQYHVQLFLSGRPKIVIIDDFIPCIVKNRSIQTAFTHSRGSDNELWVSLIEKAWAKVNSSYAMTIAGLPSEGLSTLTEAPTVVYVHKKFTEERLFEILYEADRNDYIMCTCTRTDSHEKEDYLQTTYGLVPGHAYSIISVHDISNELKLLKLRNPWGMFEWKGDYSDNSKQWTKELKEKVNYKNEDDGSFYIKLSDFLNFFPYSFICKYERGYYYEYKKYIQFPNETLVCCKIEITKPTRIMINLHQRSVREDKNISNYHLNMSRIILCKYEQNKIVPYTFVKSHASKNEKLHLEFPCLEPGIYHIYSHVEWPFLEHKNSYIISTYAEHKVEIKDLELDEIPEDYNHLIFYSYLDQHEERKLLKENLQMQVSIRDNDLGFYMILFKNLSKTDSVQINFDARMNKYVRLATAHPENQLISSEGDETVYNMNFKIEPETDYLVLYELTNEPWLSKLKLDKMNVKSNLFAKKDKNKDAIFRNLKSIKKFKTELENVFYGELESDSEVFLVFINENPMEVKLRIQLTEYVNLSPEKEGVVIKIDGNDFGYVKFNKEHRGLPIDFSFKFSGKRNLF